MGMRRVKGLKRTPMKRATKPMKRNTPKRAKADRAARKPRQAFQDEFPWCWFCENARATGVHEIASGIGNRGPAVQQRFTWAAACWDCNSRRLTDKSEWPVVRQLAFKFVNDREFFNLVEFNVLRGHAPGAITMADVIPHICRLIDKERKWQC